MTRYLLLLMTVGLLGARSLEASEDLAARTHWVKALKSFMLELEKKGEAHLLTSRERNFLWKFGLLESAWADARFDCLYAGWPSKLVASNGKKLCQSPQRGNTDYQKGNCKINELQCQPLMFGKNLCVSFQHPSDKTRALSSCEKKFQSERGGNYDHLKALTREEVLALGELSLLAHSICEEGSLGIQKGTGMCQLIHKKFKDGLKAIDRAWREDPELKVNQSQNAPLTITDSRPKQRQAVHVHSEDCATEHPLKELMLEAQVVATTVTHPMDELYDEMKREFKASPFCDPLKIINDPAKDPSGILMGKLVQELSFLETLLSGGNHTQAAPQFDQLASDYGLKSETVAEVKDMLRQMRQGSAIEVDRRILRAKIKMLVVQDFSKHQNAQEGFALKTIKDELLKNHIFVRNEAGEVECPFVTKDAFVKAIQGREAVLRSHGKSIYKKETLTIVDYSRPSNERRMFVLDLKEKKVLHNTWVAHGGGGGQAPGADGVGGSPLMSNQSGSNLSSDGFVIATQASRGNRFGPNVLLRGIDRNNKNMAARSVILHGWSSPLAEYSSGYQDYDIDNERYLPPKDVMAEVHRVDVHSTSLQDMERAYNRLRSSTTLTKYLSPTEGCLGVPMTPAKHLDRKGRDKTQLELLREDLPGSLIFNYSGPQMESDFH
jgi:hypothetical protein